MPIRPPCFKRLVVDGGIAPTWPRALVSRKGGWALALATLAAAASSSGCSSPGEPPAAPPAAPVTRGNLELTAAQRQSVRLYTVQRSDYHATVETVGVVDFDNDQATSVLSPVSGPVSRLSVSLGQRVRKGDALASVDSPDFAAAIGAYQKALATTKTDRHLADIDKDLVEHNGIAQKEAAQAETDAANAAADRDAALEELVSLHIPEETLKDVQRGLPITHLEAAIRSPIAGTVVEKLITPGQLLAAGTTPCFTVADLSRVWVMAQIFGSDLAWVSVGDAAEVTSGTGSSGLSGKVDNIAALVDPDTRSVPVRVLVVNRGDLLKKSMYVRVRIQSRAAQSGLLIPVSAVLRDEENLPFVYVAGSDDGFARRRVTLGSRTGDQYVISAGLAAGERIVVEGGLFVQFMQSQ
jgi:cobalt-zinc-cadmium efflux system membrane fusion protein